MKQARSLKAGETCIQRLQDHLLLFESASETLAKRIAKSPSVGDEVGFLLVQGFL